MFQTFFRCKNTERARPDHPRRRKPQCSGFEVKRKFLQNTSTRSCLKLTRKYLLYGVHVYQTDS